MITTITVQDLNTFSGILDKAFVAFSRRLFTKLSDIDQVTEEMLVGSEVFEMSKSLSMIELPQLISRFLRLIWTTKYIDYYSTESRKLYKI